MQAGIVPRVFLTFRRAYATIQRRGPLPFLQLVPWSNAVVPRLECLWIR